MEHRQTDHPSGDGIGHHTDETHQTDPPRDSDNQFYKGPAPGNQKAYPGSSHSAPLDVEDAAILAQLAVDIDEESHEDDFGTSGQQQRTFVTKPEPVAESPKFTFSKPQPKKQRVHEGEAKSPILAHQDKHAEQRSPVAPETSEFDESSKAPAKGPQPFYVAGWTHSPQNSSAVEPQKNVGVTPARKPPASTKHHNRGEGSVTASEPPVDDSSFSSIDDYLRIANYKHLQSQREMAARFTSERDNIQAELQECYDAKEVLQYEVGKKVKENNNLSAAIERQKVKITAYESKFVKFRTFLAGLGKDFDALKRESNESRRAGERLAEGYIEHETERRELVERLQGCAEQQTQLRDDAIKTLQDARLDLEGVKAHRDYLDKELGDKIGLLAEERDRRSFLENQLASARDTRGSSEAFSTTIKSGYDAILDKMQQIQAAIEETSVATNSSEALEKILVAVDAFSARESDTLDEVVTIKGLIETLQASRATDSELATIRSQLNEANAEARRKSEALLSVNEDLSAKAAELSSLSVDNARLVDEINTLEEKLEHLREQVQQAPNHDKDEEIKRVRRECAAHIDRFEKELNSSKQNDLKRLTSETKRLEKIRDDQKIELDALREQLDETKTFLTESEAGLNQLELSCRNTLEESENKAQRQCNVLQQHLAEAQASLEKERADHQAFRAQIQESWKLEQSKFEEQRAEATRRVIQAEAERDRALADAQSTRQKAQDMTLQRHTKESSKTQHGQSAEKTGPSRFPPAVEHDSEFQRGQKITPSGSEDGNEFDKHVSTAEELLQFETSMEREQNKENQPVNPARDASRQLPSRGSLSSALSSIHSSASQTERRGASSHYTPPTGAPRARAPEQSRPSILKTDGNRDKYVFQKPVARPNSASKLVHRANKATASSSSPDHVHTIGSRPLKQYHAASSGRLPSVSVDPRLRADRDGASPSKRKATNDAVERLPSVNNKLRRVSRENDADERSFNLRSRTQQSLRGRSQVTDNHTRSALSRGGRTKRSSKTDKFAARYSQELSDR